MDRLLRATQPPPEERAVAVDLERSETPTFPYEPDSIDDGSASLSVALRMLGHDVRKLACGDTVALATGQLSPQQPELEVGFELRNNRAARACVIRYLASDNITDAKTRTARHRAEAAIGAALRHDNVVQVYGSGVEDSNHFRVIELVDGISLRELMRRAKGERLSVHCVVNLSCTIAAALADVHDLKLPDGSTLDVVHGELCAEKILVTRDGVPKISELSVASLQGRPLRAQTEARGGKEGYVTPEQLIGQTIDRRTDMFSLALVITEMLSGDRFGKLDFATLRGLSATIVDRFTARRGVPDVLVKMLTRMTEFSTQDRPDSMAAVVEAFEAAKAAIGPWNHRGEELDVLLDAQRPSAHPSAPSPMKQADMIINPDESMLGFRISEAPITGTFPKVDVIPTNDEPADVAPTREIKPVAAPPVAKAAPRPKPAWAESKISDRPQPAKKARSGNQSAIDRLAKALANDEVINPVTLESEPPPAIAPPTIGEVIGAGSPHIQDTAPNAMSAGTSTASKSRPRRWPPKCCSKGSRVRSAGCEAVAWTGRSSHSWTTTTTVSSAVRRWCSARRCTVRVLPCPQPRCPR